MKSITIKGSKRESVGKAATKALRNAEKVPCVLYGGEQTIHFSADEKSFKGLVGAAPGVLNGGSLGFNLRKLNVRALPKNLPDFINADISKLKIGDKVVVSQLADDKLTLLHPENTVVVQVRMARAAIVDEVIEGEEEATAEGEETAAEGGATQEATQE